MKSALAAVLLLIGIVIVVPTYLLVAQHWQGVEQASWTLTELSIDIEGRDPYESGLISIDLRPVWLAATCMLLAIVVQFLPVKLSRLYVE